MNQNPSEPIRTAAFDELSKNMGASFAKNPGILGAVEAAKGQLHYDYMKHSPWAVLTEEVRKGQALGPLDTMAAAHKSALDTVLGTSNVATMLQEQFNSPAVGIVQRMNEQAESVAAQFLNPPYTSGMAKIAAQMNPGLAGLGTVGIGAHVSAGLAGLDTAKIGAPLSAGLAGIVAATSYKGLSTRFVASPEFISEVEKVWNSYAKPAIDMEKLGLGALNVASFLKPQITAQDILGRTNTHLWSESMCQAVGHMDTLFPKLLSEEEALSKLGLFKEIDWNFKSLGIDLDGIKTSEDLEDFIEDNEDIVEQVTERLVSDKEIRRQAAEIFVGPAIKQMTTTEIILTLGAIGERLWDFAMKFATTQYPEVVLVTIAINSIILFFSAVVEDRALEKRRKNRVEEVLKDWEY